MAQAFLTRATAPNYKKKNQQKEMNTLANSYTNNPHTNDAADARVYYLQCWF